MNTSHCSYQAEIAALTQIKKAPCENILTWDVKNVVPPVFIQRSMPPRTAHISTPQTHKRQYGTPALTQNADRSYEPTALTCADRSHEPTRTHMRRPLTRTALHSHAPTAHSRCRTSQKLPPCNSLMPLTQACGVDWTHSGAVSDKATLPCRFQLARHSLYQHFCQTASPS